ncbi:MAG TPA: hypothetical protein VLJ21_05375 [Candidatus Binatia bacterium]|nr:hypothetical protein [Candidatus Binatia bacterium]
MKAETIQTKKKTFADDLITQLEESLEDIKAGRIYEVTRTIEPKTGKYHVVKKRVKW